MTADHPPPPVDDSASPLEPPPPKSSVGALSNSRQSGRIYDLVTRHWARIAGGMVALLGVGEILVGGITSANSIEFYLTAWAGATGALWFLFERAEEALGVETRERVVSWIRESDLEKAMSSIPDQFQVLFDRIFGARHLSWRCFAASCAASALSGLLVIAVGFAAGFGPDGTELPRESVVAFILGVPVLAGAYLVMRIRFGLRRRLVIPIMFVAILAFFVLLSLIVSRDVAASFNLAEVIGGGLFLGAVFTGFIGFLNFIPDFISLLETRWAIQWAGSSRRLAGVLAADVLASTVIWVSFTVTFLAAANGVHPVDALRYLYALLFQGAGDQVAATFVWVAFLSTFFTSVWLWIYIASTLLSRFLLRLNSGIGFLLQVTDVEDQPFRSMGFASVCLVSTLFMVGLPFVIF